MLRVRYKQHVVSRWDGAQLKRLSILIPFLKNQNTVAQGGHKTHKTETKQNIFEAANFYFLLSYVVSLFYLLLCAAAAAADTVAAAAGKRFF